MIDMVTIKTTQNDAFMKTCCCCFSVRAGAITVSVLWIIGAILQIIGLIFAIITFILGGEAANLYTNSKFYYAVAALLSVALLLMMNQLTSSIALASGINKGDTRLMLVWIVSEIVNITAYSLGLIVWAVFFMYQTGYYNIGGLVGGVVTVYLNVHAILCVASHQRNVAREQTKLQVEADIELQTAGAPQGPPPAAGIGNGGFTVPMYGQGWPDERGAYPPQY